MGAAATVSKQEDDVAFGQKTSPSLKSRGAAMVVCSGCKTPLGIFRRKKCNGCVQLHCSRCLIARAGCFSGRPACAKCMSLAMGDYNRDYLAKQFTVRELRRFLSSRHVAIDGCTEKHDLIELVMQLRRSSSVRAEEEEHSRHISQLRENLSRELHSDTVSSADRSSNTDIGDEQSASQTPQQDASSESVAMTSDTVPTTAEAETNPEEPTAASNDSSSLNPDYDSARIIPPGDGEPSRNTTDEVLAPSDSDTNDSSMQRSPRDVAQRITLADIESSEEIDTLTVRQLKILLVNNFVDYKGCCEKQELVQKVRELWKDNRKINQTVGDGDMNATVNGDDLCKVCMDAAVDCILLECGHMVSCTSCGKRLAECPICRCYVSRVVHVFRA